MTDSRLGLIFHEHLRPRGKLTRGEALLDLAYEGAAGIPRQSARHYSYRWRVSWRTAAMLLDLYDGLTESHETRETVDNATASTRRRATQEALPGIPQRHSPMLNLLPNQTEGGDPVDPDEKGAWWDAEGDLVALEAEAQAAIKGTDDPKAVAALVRATALRYFKTYLRGDRRFRGVKAAGEREEAAQAYFSANPDRYDPSDPERPSSRLQQTEV